MAYEDLYDGNMGKYFMYLDFFKKLGNTGSYTSYPSENAGTKLASSDSCSSFLHAAIPRSSAVPEDKIHNIV